MVPIDARKSAGKRPWSPVKKELGLLRKKGLRNPPLHQMSALVAVAGTVSGADTVLGKVIDALGIAIDECWGGALGNGPSHRDVVRLCFGLPAIDDPEAPDTSSLGSAARTKVAWEYSWHHLDTHNVVFETFRTGRLTETLIAIAQKLVELEAAAREVRTSPSASTAPISKDAPLSDAPAVAAPTDEAGGSRTARRRRAIIVCVGALVASAALVLVALRHPWRQSASDAVPPFGAIVNAQTGAWSFNAPNTPSEYPVGVDEGGSLVACDLTSDPGCAHPFGHASALPGHRLYFTAVLNNSYFSAVPILKVAVHVGGFGDARGLSELGVYVQSTWPTAGEFGTGSVTTRTANSPWAYLKLPAGYGLQYVKDSTTLHNKHTHFFARLPNGIFQEGVTLQDLGEPHGCHPCDQQYIRAISFEATVVPRQLTGEVHE